MSLVKENSAAVTELTSAQVESTQCSSATRRYLDTLCRVCGRPGTLDSLDNVLSNLLNKHLSIKVDDKEGWPRQICSSCSSLVFNWDYLVNTARGFDLHLSNLLSTMAVTGSPGAMAVTGASGTVADIGASEAMAVTGAPEAIAVTGGPGAIADTGASGTVADIGASGTVADIGASETIAVTGASEEMAVTGASGTVADIGARETMEVNCDKHIAQMSMEIPKIEILKLKEENLNTLSCDENEVKFGESSTKSGNPHDDDKSPTMDSTSDFRKPDWSDSETESTNENSDLKFTKIKETVQKEKSQILKSSSNPNKQNENSRPVVKVEDDNPRVYRNHFRAYQYQLKRAIVSNTLNLIVKSIQNPGKLSDRLLGVEPKTTKITLKW